MWYCANMNSGLRRTVSEEVPRRLAELLDIGRGQIKVQDEPATGDTTARSVDVVVSVHGRKFAVETKASGDAAAVTMAARSVRSFAEAGKGKIIPVVAVPYMGEVGQRICDELGVCWLDLSGNVHLVAPGLRVNIQGNPNRFKRPGRPRNVFAPKSSRIARWMLMNRSRSFSQRELAHATGLGEGFTSRIVRRLEEQGLVARDAEGAVTVADYQTMLDAWWEAYDFSKHHTVRGHVAGRGGDEVLHRLAGQLDQHGIKHAATGLAGAWLIDRFAGFRLVVLFVGQMPPAEVTQTVGFHEEERGENVWLVLPDDEGVFHGAEKRDGIRCVHPVQVYLDLKDHPERSIEAAQRLRETLLKKDGDA